MYGRHALVIADDVVLARRKRSGGAAGKALSRDDMVLLLDHAVAIARVYAHGCSFKPAGLRDGSYDDEEDNDMLLHRLSRLLDDGEVAAIRAAL